MTRHIVVVDRRKDFPWDEPDCEVMTAREYIARPFPGRDRIRVINLCRDFSYLSLGYYCSLLAEARGHRVIPSGEVMLELNWKRLYKSSLPELEEGFAKALGQAENGGALTLNFFFGRSDDERLKDVARRLFDLFRCPILSVDLRYKEGWRIRALGTLPVGDIPPDCEAQFHDAFNRHTHGKWRAPRPKAQPRYHMAILHDPQEALPPSDPKALERFVEAGRGLGVNVEFITRRDLAKLGEYDALFIRETTSLDHHTYRFARKAVAEGMPVIDDPGSILKCTNKVYLAELLQANKVPTPRTSILDSRGLKEAQPAMSYPVVLKIPDGSFSRGVFLAKEEAEFQTYAQRVLDESDVLLVQEFMPTKFDWRVGVLNGEPLYVSQYFMSKGHWQIVKHEGEGRFTEGGSKTLKVEDAPTAVVELGVRAARLVGDGLYGVDLKETENGVYVIEVNDNPSLEAGVEDAVLKEELYRKIVQDFIRRIEAR